MLDKPFSILLVICAIFCTSIVSCKKDTFITSSNATIATSVDSLKYDTVFTSVGSITQIFKINNTNNQKLLISKVKLMGGSASQFRINVNGFPGPEVDNLEVEANDSIYVFVTVTVNPTVANLPFVISDSILVNYNGNNKFVQLQAFGQNAHFLRDSVISSNTSFSTDKPYVILGSLTVNSGSKLIMPAGCKVYFHADAPLVVNGTLITNGTNVKPVIFKGDRLDQDYKNLPASWPGIYFTASSKASTLRFTNVLNAYQGIVVDSASVDGNPKLTVSQSIIDNSYNTGMLFISSYVNVNNTLISNCGNNINISLGGQYNFINCTAASYGNDYIEHKNPVLAVFDYLTLDNVTYTNNLKALFENCIFWGDNGTVDDEVITQKQGTGTSYSVLFRNSLFKIKNPLTDADTLGVIVNKNPSFDSINISVPYYDFHITKDSLAPGINKGLDSALSARDLDNNTRKINGFPDLGCYESSR